MLIDAKTMDRLEDELGDLAVQWRRKPDHATVKKYHRLYKQLVELGWDQSLDVESHLPNELMPQEYHDLRARPRENAGADLQVLTERELDVFRKLLTGASNREIAALLIISESTVKNHVSSILTKLQLTDRREVVRYVRIHNVDIDSLQP